MSQLNNLLEGAPEKDRADELRNMRKKFFLPFGRGRVYLNANSLGPPVKKAIWYVVCYFYHWIRHQVKGHFEPMKGVTKNPKGFAYFRDMFREPAYKIMGAEKEAEVALVAEMTTTMNSIVAHVLRVQYYAGRRDVFFDEASAFPSDDLVVKEQVRIFNKYHAKANDPLRLIPITHNDDGLSINHEKALRQIHESGGNLAAWISGNGGAGYKSGQILDLSRIGPAVRSVGGTTIINLAHALGATPLFLKDWGIGYAITCSYKLLSGGAGGPSLLYINSEEDVSDLGLVGWFSLEDPIAALQGKRTKIKENAQRSEASNPNVLGGLPFLAALRLFVKNMPAIFRKAKKLNNYFFECWDAFQKGYGTPLKLITPRQQSGIELMFTLHDADEAKIKKLEQFLLKKGLTVDVRDQLYVRVGMFPPFTRYRDIARLFKLLEEFILLT